MRPGLPYTRLGYRLNELALTVTEAQKALTTGDLLHALEGEHNEVLHEDFAEMAGNFDVLLGDVVQRLQRFSGVIKTIKSAAVDAR
jgi:hypothetical protein